MTLVKLHYFLSDFCHILTGCVGMTPCWRHVASLWRHALWSSPLKMSFSDVHLHLSCDTESGQHHELSTQYTITAKLLHCRATVGVTMRFFLFVQCCRDNGHTMDKLEITSAYLVSAQRATLGCRRKWTVLNMPSTFHTVPIILTKCCFCFSPVIQKSRPHD